jgi:hypothetical protein
MENGLAVNASAWQTTVDEEVTLVTPASAEAGRPDPQWVRGRCPECGDDLVSNLYYVGGKGYLIVWECWASLGDAPGCRYRKVL